MGWQVVVVALSVLLVVVGLVLIVAAVKRREQPDPPDDSEDFLTEYFALEEFNDAEFRERLEHLRGVPELR